ncbi:MAG: exodeoxyribonuclease VII small subunit [Bacteroidetes bacterium]|nr:MAG: exodeoxyribonuclease VII small subunit [Bacteroidota bacterium]
MKKEKEMSYEAAFSELQQLVAELQGEAVSMDTLTEKTARARELIRYCREKLRQTEETVKKLVEE